MDKKELNNLLTRLGLEEIKVPKHILLGNSKGRYLIISIEHLCEADFYELKRVFPSIIFLDTEYIEEDEEYCDHFYFNFLINEKEFLENYEEYLRYKYLDGNVQFFISYMYGKTVSYICTIQQYISGTPFENLD